MSGDAVRKLTAWTGLAAVVLLVGSVALMPSDVPGFDATPEQVVNYTLDDRRALLIATVLVATAFTLLIVFYAGLRTLLGRAEGAPALLSTIGYGAFLVVIALGLVSMGVLQAQAFVALDGDPATVKVLHELRLILVNVSAVPTILSAGAIGVAMLRTRFPARWVGGLSLAAAAGHVLAVIALARTGFFSPSGGGALVGPVVLLVWIVAASVVLLQLPRRVNTPATAVRPPTAA
jgi:hypothetical protein